MPWQSSDAHKHTGKAQSEKSKKLWAKVANSALARGASEGSAIKQASGVVKRRMG